MLKSLVLGFGLIFSFFAGAEDAYPNKSVRIIVNYAPGGLADIGARIVAQQLTNQLGKSFIVENRPGGSGTIGTGFVAKSVPDGHTLLLSDTSFGIMSSLFKSLPFDVLKDFAPIVQMTRSTNVLVISPSLNMNTLKEFIASAKSNPGKYNYGSAGQGALSNLSCLLFNTATKVNIVHIPYDGGAGDLNSGFLSGQVQMLITTIPSVMGNVKAGRMKALGVTTDGERSMMLPDVPSMKEEGVNDMVVYNWIGLVAPTATPKTIISKVHDEVVKSLSLPAVKERFSALDVQFVGSNPEQFSNHIRSEVSRWSEVIKAAGITVK